MRPLSGWSRGSGRLPVVDAASHARLERVRAHRRWTQSDITDLRGRIQAGATLSDLSRALGRQSADVSTMAGRLGLVLPADRASAEAL
jgi:hypothetical protein